MSLSEGDRLGRYEILSRLGAGGMGEVYRAKDTALDREIAIKVLPDRVAGDPKRLEQFQLEARAVAALSDPNILEIHDVGEQAGVHYAVTELLEGETLRERIPASGLPWQRVVEIGAAIADALAAAHGRGIVHRDLKPENVFVTSAGRVKVLDFGLAHVQEAVSAEAPTGEVLTSDTRTGPVYGTVGYLAPELMAGCTADARSDIFALGCVLYEMACGRRAFRRDSAPETLWATLREEPPMPSSLGAILPAELDSTIARCLEKSPDARFQSAADLAFAVRAIASGSAPDATALSVATTRRRRWITLGAAGAVVAAVVIAAVVWGPRLISPTGDVATEPDPNRMVVVPFDNRTGDPDHDVIGLMAADWLTHGMSEIGGLEVIASSSAVAATELAADAPAASLEVARLVGAGTIVAGAYYLQGELLQINAEIVAAETGELLHEVEPVSGLISEPLGVVELLRHEVLGLLTDRDPTIGKFSPPKFEAYREYLAGGEVFLDTPAASIEHFERAAELDPDFLQARMFLFAALNRTGRFDEARVLLEELERRRDELSPYERLGLDSVRLYYEGNRIELLPVARELVAQDPLNPIQRSLHVEAAVQTNHPQEAVETIEALDWNEVDYLRPALLCEALHMLGRHERELEVARELVAGFPAIRILPGVLARALAALGRTDELAELVEESFPDSANLHAWLAFEASVELRAHGSAGASRQFAERALDSLRSAPIHERFVQTWPGIPGNWVSTQHPLQPSTGWWLGNLMVLAERPEDALAAFNELASSDDPNSLSRSSAAQVAAMLGDRETALEFARHLEMLEQPEWYGGGSFARALIAAGLGEQDEAVELLYAALHAGFKFSLVFHRSPFLEPLRGTEAFEEFLRPKG